MAEDSGKLLTREDALVFLAVAWGTRSGTATVAETLSAARSISGAYPGRTSLEDSVRRLSGAGLLSASKARISVTPAGAEALGGLRSTVASGQWEELSGTWKKSRPVAGELSHWRLPEEGYLEACLALRGSGAKPEPDYPF